MMRARLGLFFLIAISVAACRAQAPARVPEARFSLASLLGKSDDVGFAHADEPRAFTFPDDFGPHPAFRTEWWYVTGILVDEATPARRFGYQLTFFRQALAPDSPQRASPLAARDVVMAHAAITDIANGHFFADERLDRAAGGLAGVAATPLRVWVDDWSLESAAAAPNTSIWPLHLVARSSNASPGNAFTLDVTLTSNASPPVLQGDRGWSQKGPEPGNASYYVSLVHVSTHGQITIDNRSFAVAGESWLDREWSTSALGRDRVGWDWLAVTLPEGRALMLYRLRDARGATAPESRATLIERDGRTRVVGPDGFAVSALGTWISPHTGAAYPAGLRVVIPSFGADLTARPLMADQELNLSVRYWEGAVAAADTHGDPRWASTGYLELTGYAR